MSPNPGGAPFCQLGEGHGIFGAAADIEDPLVLGMRAGHLSEDQSSQVIRVKGIADLVTGSMKADVSQRPLAGVGMNPEGENSLLCGSELSGAGQYAATIDPNGHCKRLTIFQRQDLRGTLRAAVERDGSAHRKIRANPPGGDAHRQRLCGIKLEGTGASCQRQGSQIVYAVNPAGAE